MNEGLVDGDYLRLCVEARIALADLVTVDRELSATERHTDTFIVMTKHALLVLANAYDLETAVRRVYLTHYDLSELYKPLEKQLAFARYLRNIYVGHVNRELVEKAIEWKPEVVTIAPLKEQDEPANIIINLALLETAINSFVDVDGKQKVFGGDTDLNYPPDATRFLVFLTESVHGTISYLKALVAALQSHLEPPQSHEENMELFVKAGMTDFRFLTKGRR
jgi:hypothetical protein